MTRLNRFLVSLFLALAAVGIFRLRLDTDIVNLLPGGSPVTEGLRLYQERFLQSGELLVTLQSSDPAAVEQATQSVARELARATNLVRSAFWQPPARESISDSARFLAYLWLNAPTQLVTDLTQSLSPEVLPETLAQTREQIVSSLSPNDLILLPRDPLRLSSIAESDSGALESPEQFFASDDGTFRIVYVYAESELKDYAQCSVWLAQIRAILARTVPESIQIGLTGRPVFVHEIASGMRSDMSTAAPGTLIMIALLFYLAHREWRSLFLLVTTLALVMLGTLAAGAALLGSINVISIGFAVILVGLAEDFGVVLHQEAKSHSLAGAAEIRKAAGPPIWWSAITTASAFALLNLSALPGLRQLGTLIALGILLGAWAMLHLFLPALIRFCPRGSLVSGVPKPSVPFGLRLPITVSILLLVIAGTVLWLDPPSFSSEADVLRPRKSEASATLKKVQQTIGSSVEPLWLMVKGESIAQVRQDLEKMQAHLGQNSERIGAESFTLPLSLWPDPGAQQRNLPALKSLAGELPRVRQATLAAGFTEDALALTATVLLEWQSYSGDSLEWPSGRVAEWLLPKFVSIAPSNYIALGVIQPTESFAPSLAVPEDLRASVLVSGWDLMGKQIVARVKRETPVICGAVVVVVIVALWLSFRAAAGVILSLGVLAFSGLVLLAAMGLFSWEWNLINLTALPLLLGMGIDYSIHMQSALQRFQGRTGEVTGVARALALAGSTSIIGFTFLSFSSNLGMASLGRVCALGLSVLLLVSIFLLPAWARLLTLRPASAERAHG